MFYFTASIFNKTPLALTKKSANTSTKTVQIIAIMKKNDAVK
jgi:hypothetical protein